MTMCHGRCWIAVQITTNRGKTPDSNGFQIAKDSDDDGFTDDIIDTCIKHGQQRKL